MIEASRDRPEVDWSGPLAGLRRQQNELRRKAFETLIDPAPALASIIDHPVATDSGSLRVRIYRPRDAMLPVHVFAHGGAWCFGTVEQYDGYCATLAVDGDCAVASVDYRMAPEHPFPAAVEDCFAALTWIHSTAPQLGLDPGRLSMGGNSAGGNLAAAVALIARDRSGPALSWQCLDVPATDFTLSYPSVQADHINAGYTPTRQSLEVYRNLYLGESGDRCHPYASPLLAPDVSGLPPALIMTCGFDALRDEGEAYGRRLREAGVACSIVRWTGLTHGTNMFTALLPEARSCQDLVSSTLRRVHWT
jgi:acetyl esterase